MQKFLFFILVVLSANWAAAQQGTIDYKMTMSGVGKGTASTSTMSFSGGKVRVETNINMQGFSHKQVMLMLPNKPNTVTMLDAAAKTYSEISTNSTAKDAGLGKTSVKIVGKEKIQNLNCTHVVMTIGNRPMDIWTTKDIAGYENMLNYWKSSISGGNDQLYNELKKAGAEGFVVKTQIKNPEGGVTMELVKYDAKPVAASAFEIPAGYQKGSSLDPEKMKTMSPAERKKMLEEMMKKYDKKQ